jgi:hypothetical protein
MYVIRHMFCKYFYLLPIKTLEIFEKFFISDFNETCPKLVEF